MNHLLAIFTATAVSISGAFAAETTTPKPVMPAKNDPAICGMACCQVIADSKGTVTDSDMVASKELVDSLKAALIQIRVERREDFKKFWNEIAGKD